MHFITSLLLLLLSSDPFCIFESTSSNLNGLLLIKNGFDSWKGLVLLFSIWLKLTNGLEFVSLIKVDAVTFVGDFPSLFRLSTKLSELNRFSVSVSPLVLSKLSGCCLPLFSGPVIMTFSNFPRSEWPKNVTVTGVVQRFWLTSSGVFGDWRLELVSIGVVLVGPVTDSVSLSPPFKRSAGAINKREKTKKKRIQD